jgi:hypothetical protein
MQQQSYVFLADDDSDDQMLFTEAFMNIAPDLALAIASNGNEAVQFLRKLRTGTKPHCTGLQYVIS